MHGGKTKNGNWWLWRDRLRDRLWASSPDSRCCVGFPGAAGAFVAATAAAARSEAAAGAAAGEAGAAGAFVAAAGSAGAAAILSATYQNKRMTRRFPGLCLWKLVMRFSVLVLHALENRTARPTQSDVFKRTYTTKTSL